MEFLSLEDARRIMCMGKTTQYSAIKAGLLTKPITAFGRTQVIPRHELDAIMKARLAEKSNDEIRILVNSLHAARQQQT